MRNTTENNGQSSRGYSLIEMLIVTAMIVILAVIPVALLRRSRDKVYEAEALSALRMMALAYENYWAQNGHEYPHYRLDGVIEDDIEFNNAEMIWDTLVSEKLIPQSYSGTTHDRPDLLAHGYRFTILPARAGLRPGSGVRNSYAMAMMPYEDSVATRGLAMVTGQRFFSSYPTAVPRKMQGLGLDDLKIYTIGD